MATTATEWRKLPLNLAELCVDTTLRCGQSFRWRKINDEWHCALQGRIISLKQDPEQLHYRATFPSFSKGNDKKPDGSTSESKSKPKPSLTPLTPPSSNPSSCPSPLNSSLNPSPSQKDTTTPLLHHYFALSLSLSTLYQTWSLTDPNFARRSPSLPGIRILQQDAWESLVAFICSSNNNIARIGQMVGKLCVHYGAYLGEVAGEEFYDFPAPEDLAGDGVEERLRGLGFGYRAKYIAATARCVRENGTGWLDGLRNPSSPALLDAALSTANTLDIAATEDNETSSIPTYKAAHASLLTLPGVGPKVADCVCLMGLGWGQAVPVDTHVWQIAQRDYGLGGVKSKTFSGKMYDVVGDHFRGIWGEYAGWAQSVLFTANLKSFQGEKGKREVKDEDVKTKLEGVEDGVVKTVKIEEVGGHEVGKAKRKRKATVAVVEVKKENADVQLAEVKISSASTNTSKRRRTRSNKEY